MGAASVETSNYLSVHGRRLGIANPDPSVPTNSTALLVDNQVVASTRGAILILTQLGKNGAGALALAGVKVGDKVLNATNITTPGDVTSSFEATISVDGQIQQSAATNLSAAQVLFVVQPKS